MNKRILFLGLALLVMFAFWGCGKSEQAKQGGQDTTAVQGAQPGQTPQMSQTPPEPTGQQPVKMETGKKETAPPPEPKNITLTIPANSGISVTLSDSIQTNKNQVGDHFSGLVATPITAQNKVVIPEGSKVDLVITQLVKGGTLKTPPEIAFTIDNVTLPNGKTYKVDCDSIYQKGRSHTDREVGMIGGGAAAGAIIGGLAGKGKGAAIGAAVGAAAGTGAAAATGRQNLVYAPGQQVNFTTQQAISVTVPRK